MTKNPGRCAIELDGITYLCSGAGIEYIDDLKDIEGDKWLVSDLHGSISRTMTIEAPAKYTEVMLRKKLQESGEYDEPISVLTHWRHKKERNTTDVFFTTVPTRIYDRYLQQIKEDKDNLLLCS